VTGLSTGVTWGSIPQLLLLSIMISMVLVPIMLVDEIK